MCRGKPRVNGRPVVGDLLFGWQYDNEYLFIDVVRKLLVIQRRQRQVVVHGERHYR